MIKNIFHQIVRYDYAQKAINAMRTSERHSILEVGAGAHGNLSNYLPNDELTFLDIELPEEVLEDKRFVVGDATNLQYEDDAFDFVIALDVIEHIPPEKRQAFITNINRVAKQGVVLSAPFTSENENSVDELMKVFYRLNGIEPPVWVDEHIDCTLPSQAEIAELVSKCSVPEENILTFYGIKRSLMTKMLIMEAIASANPQFGDFFGVVNDDYIKRVLAQDIFLDASEAIKLYTIWMKESETESIRKKIAQQYDEYNSAVVEFEKQYDELISLALPLLSQEKNKINTHEIKAFFGEQFLQTTTKYEHLSHEVKEQIEESNEKQREMIHLINQCTHLNSGIRLNVVLVTFNHANFIRETLQTILSQKTSFDFNIIVADDCSTDNTVEIIKEMEATTDIPFVYLPNDNNLGIMKNYKRAFSYCDADYVAIMEGDDLWTDNLRLQKHVEFLDSHSECSMSFNRFVVKNFEEGITRLQPRFSEHEELQYFRYVSGHDLAYDNLIGNFSTCVYRSSALKSLPEQMYDIKGYDWLTNIMVSRMGFIGCLIQPMSIYRIHSKGVWSGQTEEEQLNSMIQAIETYDAYTNHEFTGGFTAHKERLKATLAVKQMAPNVSNAKKSKIKRVLRKVFRLHNYIPPIFIHLVKLIVPKALINKFRTIL